MNRLIHLVEPDPKMRYALREVLTQKGFAVQEFATTAEAQGAALKPCHALVLELGHPFLAALKLADEFRAQQPAALVIFMTGRSREELGSAATGRRLLFKPFDIESLLSLL